MADTKDADLRERVQALEKTVSDQEAIIDGVRTVLANLLAAQSVQHRDARLAAFLEDWRESDLSKYAQGGTDRISPAFFDARSNFFGELLCAMRDSPVFDQFWHRSWRWKKEERQRRDLERIRGAIAKKAER